MADFHFIRPWWLLAIIALVFALNLLKKYRLSQSGWQQLLPKHLANVLVDKQQNHKQLSLILPFIIGLLTIVALAGPTWKKLPQPVYQTARGSVLIMDMSYSMYATDISPNRLTRSRYKAIDLLERLKEGETGLIAYAGDAFTISPLTDDINNIKLLLPSLSPELMPELGSNPLAALTLAHEMLKNSGHNKGDIYWFTDGIDNYDIQDITDWSRSNNHRLNILGIGTKSGAPIKLNNGELMKDSGGSIIVPKLSISALKGSAKRGQGNYATLSNSNNDIEQLLRQPFNIEEQEQKESSNTGDQWQEVGPYLLLLVLPLLLPYFRRGRLLAVLPVFILITPIDKSYAQSSTLPEATTSLRSLNSVETVEQIPIENVTTSFWNDLWQTKDQQGQKQFNTEAFQQAANSFENSSWQGSSYYRLGNYEQALKAFQQKDTAEALYNQGNALAQLKRIDEAIEAYDQALKKDPKHEDAIANKAYLEELKKQQEQQKDQQQDQNKDKNNDENQDQQDQESQNQDQEQKESDDPSQDSDSEQKGEKKEGADKEQSEEEKAQEEEQKKAEQEKQSKENEAKEPSDEQAEQTPAQLRAAEKLAEETEQKHQQLLNKVTDDPYILLRNKMQLEYQKRRNNRSSAKGTKQW